MRAGEDSVVSGSYDATIRLWCLKTGNCRKVPYLNDVCMNYVFFDPLHLVNIFYSCTL